MRTAEAFPTELVAIDELKPHPRNYRVHPDDELDHIAESIRTYGIYRNIVTARDLTLLAGHGVTLGAKRLGLREVPIVRLDLDPEEPRAIKLLVADNEIAHLAVVDDRLLTELMKEVRDADSLLGTGYDDRMLANLILVTRPASEIAGFDAAAQWVGMPSYEQDEETSVKLILNFRNVEARQEAIDKLGLRSHNNWRSAWYPPEEMRDPRSMKFET